MPDFDNIHYCPVARRCEVAHFDRSENFKAAPAEADQLRLYVAAYRRLVAEERTVNSRAITPNVSRWNRVDTALTAIVTQLDDEGYYGLSHLLGDERDATLDDVYDIRERVTRNIETYLKYA